MNDAMPGGANLFGDAAISKRYYEHYGAEIVNYIEREKDNMHVRNVLHTRPIGEDVEVELVDSYDRVGAGAVIAGKGHIPAGMGVKGTPASHVVYQIIQGFELHDKDRKIDPKYKTRHLTAALGDIHRTEDNTGINGNTLLNLPGISTIGAANPNGKGVASGATGSDFNNKGKWAGETGTDPNADLIEMLNRMDSRFSQNNMSLCGHRNDLSYLFNLDSQRNQYWKNIATLLGRPDDVSPWNKWMFSSDYYTRGKVYLVAKDEKAYELAIANNPRPVFYAMARGMKWPVDVYEWLAFERHNTACVVELVIT